MYIICDIGGTKTRLACADNLGLVCDPVIFDTPQSYEAGKHRLNHEILALTEGLQLDGIIIGIAGSLYPDKKSLFKSPHLEHWESKPISHDLRERWHVPVYMENDAALVGLGEAVFGAGAGSKIVAYITDSTGVGGARLVDGKIDAAASGFEPGHQIIIAPDVATDIFAPSCFTCKTPGHLEAFVGGASLQAHYGADLDNISSHDEELIARYLAYGIYNALVFWSPDIVVLGGGLVMHGVIKLDKVNVYLEQVNQMIPQLPKIVKAELEDIGGLYGGVAYLDKLVI